MRSAKQIRTEFIGFFKDRGHDFVPSSPIVPIGDQTLLFANAGMNQFKDIFLGLTVPQCRRVANSQKCLRVSGKHNDLEEVGKDTYHHTFFEMLGNWSFNDYFKAETIEWAWQLLTKVWGIDENLLWATVFAGDAEEKSEPDTEAADLWTKVTAMPKERVLFCGKKDNFWEMGDTGPCGPCSEIHIDLGPDRCNMKDVLGHKCAVNAGCARFIELWNLVFIQFNRQQDGTLVPLSAKYVDTGAGLERIVAVIQNRKGNYDTDLFMPIIDQISRMSGHKYTSTLGNKTDNAFRVISDHIRAVAFAITDGATPSNEGRGYVIRRILRRAARYGRVLGMHEPFIYKLLPVVVDVMGDAFGEIKERADFVSTVIESEEASFGRTLDRGIEIFNSAADKAAKTKEKMIAGGDAFQLYDTFGFPVDLTQLMARERGLSVDTAQFDDLMSQQRQRARASQKQITPLISADTELPITEDVHKYHTDSCESKILGWIDFEGFHTKGSFGIDDIVDIKHTCIDHAEEKSISIVLKKTCFYAEAGGQVGDSGIIESSKGQFVVDRTEKMGDCIFHWGKFSQGSFAVGEKITAIVSKDRNSIKKNHTATHLLQWALQQKFGKTVAQQGSLVGPDYLRFDFTCPKALTNEQIADVEKLVTEKITADLPVSHKVMAREQAEKVGAMALFGEKYGNEVRVVAIGAEDEQNIDEAFSREFCGGTHVDRLGTIGGFKIIKEESISAGVRRITALTGQGLAEYMAGRSAIVDELSSMLKVPAEEIVGRVERIVKDNKKLAKQLKSASKSAGVDIMSEARKLLDSCERIGPTVVITSRLTTASVQQAREAIDMIKKKAKSAAVVFAFADKGKVTLLAGVTDDLIKKGLKAGDIIKQIAPIVDGRGGGREQLAQAGGKNPEKIDDALAEAVRIIKEKLG